ncbi:MAG TPA: response regulator [Burkholderiales bacterium]|jgi:CheY-like chemotaxis protein|nr:response regulator [Burkholderiales bacterium]
MSELQEIDILMAEDNARDAEMTERALRKHNLANRLVWVRDGVEALDFIYCRGKYASRDSARLPRLLLLDLKMPRLDGIEVLRAIKADERMRAIPVVVMTSSNEERDVVESYRLGVNSYIVKPIDFAKFFEVVVKVGLYWVLANRVPG